MGHFFITGPEREHPFHASNVRGHRDLKANPKMSEEYRNVRGEFRLSPSTNKRDGSGRCLLNRTGPNVLAVFSNRVRGINWMFVFSKMWAGYNEVAHMLFLAAWTAQCEFFHSQRGSAPAESEKTRIERPWQRGTTYGPLFYNRPGARTSISCLKCQRT